MISDNDKELVSASFIVWCIFKIKKVSKVQGRESGG